MDSGALFSVSQGGSVLTCGSATMTFKRVVQVEAEGTLVIAIPNVPHGFRIATATSVVDLVSRLAAAPALPLKTSEGRAIADIPLCVFVVVRTACGVRFCA